MTDLTYAIILLILALGGVVVRKTFFHIPIRELKRRAENQDPRAARLYRAAAFGNSLRGLLWLYIGLTSAATFILMARALPVWVSLIIVGPLLWIVFSLIPATRSTKPGLRLTLLVTPVLAWLLNYLHRPISRIAERIEQRYSPSSHTRMFERDDLIDLLNRQQEQSDNRVSEEELEIAKRALNFGHYQVSDVFISRKQLKTVLADDTIGPVLIDELHKGGQGQLPVRESAKGPIVGVLSLTGLDLKKTAHVSDVMDETVYYLHEADSLSEALHAFFETNHPLFVVVNSFEEYVGIVTIQNIVRQLLGHVPGEDFDHYSNLGAVAARYGHSKKPDEEPEKSEETPVKTDEEVVE